MPSFIIHHESCFNIYSTISDTARFSQALTLDELTAYTKDEYGKQGLSELPARIDRAVKCGTSCNTPTSLEGILLCNRAGEGESELTEAEFITKFLSNPKPERESIINTIDDLVSNFLYYDRKEDEDLPRGAIEEAVKSGAITVDDMCKRFETGIRDHFNGQA